MDGRGGGATKCGVRSAPKESVATNMVAAVVTNLVPVFMTNLVQVPVTNLVAKPDAMAAIDATGSIINTVMPGIGSIVALALGGLYHGYRQVRNRKVNEALIQGGRRRGRCSRPRRRARRRMRSS